MNREFVEKLGWKSNGYWANREVFSQYHYTIIEHNGCWYIPKDDDLYYIENVDEKILEEFTYILKTKHKIETNPKEYTLFQYKECIENLLDFYDKYYNLTN